MGSVCFMDIKLKETTMKLKNLGEIIIAGDKCLFSGISGTKFFHEPHWAFRTNVHVSLLLICLNHKMINCINNNPAV